MKILKIAVVSLLAGWLASSAPLAAQQAPGLEPGQRSLLERPPLPAGVLKADSSRTGAWLPTGSDLRYSLDMASSDGVPRWVRGAVYGIGIGAVVGGPTGVLVSYADGEAGAGDGYVPEWFVNLISFGTAGAVVGGLLGGLIAGT